MLLRPLLLAMAFLMLLVPASLACGSDTDCMIGDRHYRIRMPAGYDGKTKLGAIVWAHGYTGSAAGAMRSKGFADLASSLNVALISVKSAYKGWSIPGSPSTKDRPYVDELAYFDRVLDDAAARFPIDRKRIIASGFSSGGMMVWSLACHRSHQFAGFVPIAGTFWEPIPEACTTPPTSVIHVHGNADKVVPLEGRPIRTAHQGNVSHVVEMYARFGGFGDVAAKRPLGLECSRRTNAGGHLLVFCLYEGGHDLYIDHLRQAWDMLVTAGKL